VDDARKIKTKIAPVYPQLARTMHLAGTVRVIVVITPAGTVKNVKALGGHPLLVESVTDAVKRWKYESAPQETTTVVEVKFTDEGS
jgi:TonB family protein